MSADEEVSKSTTPAAAAEAETTTTTAATATDPVVEQERSEKILKAKELYSLGSRNFLVKSYLEAADELSQVCALYEELYGELSAELGMPYLLYAKSLIALAVDENKVLDVPDEADDDDDEDDEDEEQEPAATAVADGEAVSEKAEEKVAETVKSPLKTATTTNGAAKKTANEPDSTAVESNEKDKETATTAAVSKAEEPVVSSSIDTAAAVAVKNGNGSLAPSSTTAAVKPVVDDEKPSTSNGDTGDADADTQEEEEENEAASNLQLAWEILELAAKIFSRQGLSGLPNLAEVQTELANIEFENNIMDAAREDYEKALRIYMELPKSYHRAMAEIHYKIGLTYLMQQLNKEGAASLKEACDLIDAEIVDIKEKDELSEKDKNNIQDMEETKQEIRAKIDEIEETQAQNIAEVRAALDSYIKPLVSQNAADAGTSKSAAVASSSSSITSSSTSSTSPNTKPTDITHLIKRKKPDEPGTEADASPAKRPAV